MNNVLNVFIPSNRVDRHGKPTHVDGMNEIIRANRTSKIVGARQERENVMLVHDYVSAAMRAQGFVPLDTKAFVYVRFVEPNQRRDVSNIFGGLKWVLDGLSRPRGSKRLGAGAIVDDSPRWVEVECDVSIDRAKPGVSITVMPIEERT